MEPEPWEILDLDLDHQEDSILVPCKRKNPSTTLSLPSTQTNKTLKTCSVTPQSHPTRVVPGPAGAVQLAMHRKTFCEDPIPTQEYIRRAVEDPAHEDEDFSRSPWLLAVDFVRRAGLVGSDGVAIGTPLSLIKSGIKDSRINQVIAIVKSSSPNGLGDLMVTLKDPTGTIDASIHRRVLMEGEFSKDLSIGAVLILQKVAVFSPSRCRRYLNITLDNIIKVISKDCETPLELNHSSLTDKHAAAPETGEKSPSPPKMTQPSQGRTEGILNSLRQNANARQTVPTDTQIELPNPSSSFGAGGSRSQPFHLEKEVSMVRDAADEHTNGTPAKEISSDEEILLEEPGNRSLSGKIQFSNTTQNMDVGDATYRLENKNLNGYEKQKQQQLLASKGPPPEWTDEQLDELLAFDDI